MTIAHQKIQKAAHLADRFARSQSKAKQGVTKEKAREWERHYRKQAVLFTTELLKVGFEYLSPECQASTQETVNRLLG